ncbi:DUF1692-domain-containing protein, partial [Wilcoxina mikolae CBS 423.85]
SGLKTFDAFPKTRQTYRVSSSRGGALTIFVTILCIYLTWMELRQHLDGTETQAFSVEHTAAADHALQINLDITVAMPCDSLHINVQDAALDHILAGDILTKEGTSFDDTSAHRLVPLGGREDHVYNVLAKAKKSKFGKSGRKTSSWLRKVDRSSCRIYGSMAVNRVMGDFHITAAGHGYGSTGQHIDHKTFNFSHVVNELSFGDFYPKLVNPLDDVKATTDENFYKFQYYLSIVPTIYHSENSHRSLLTNQYAVTEHSRQVSSYQVPGIFFKFDIEPLTLTINERRMPFTKFAVRMVNIIGGVLVSGNWCYKLVDLFVEYFRRKKRSMDGMI